MIRLLAMALALGVGVAHALPAKTWVLAIGNNLGEPDEVQLRYAESDAAAVVGVLRQLGGVPADRVKVLAGADADAVRRALSDVALAMARSPEPGPSAVVVYYSGHADAAGLHLDGTRLPLAELTTAVRKTPATTRLLVLDACRSGGATRVKGVRATQAFEVNLVDDAAVEGFAVITSSTARESSLESDRLGGSFFTHYLVAGLRGAADEDADAAITLDEAYQYAYRETVRASGRTQSLQHPTFAMDMKGRGAVVLARLKGQRGQGRLTLREPAIYLVGDARDGRLVAELKPARRAASVSLPARRYQIQHRRPREYLTYEVDLRAGQSLDLAVVPARATRYDRLVRKGGGARAVVHGVGVLLGARGGVVEGEGAAPHLVLEYGLDTRWLTTTLRLRGTTTATDGAGIAVDRAHRELGVGLTLQRFVDLDWLSLSFGVLAEAGWHQHAYSGAHSPPSRATWSGGFGALLGVERVLFGGVSLRLEAGPTTTVLQTARVEAGAEVDSALTSATTWWGAAGLRWRL